MATLGQVEQATLTANSDVASRTSTTQTTLGNLDVVGGGELNSSTIQSSGFAGTNWGAKTYDFVGIANAEGVEEMKNAIKSYCDAVNAELDKMVTTANPEGTFAGTYTSSINDFLKAMQASCMNMVNGLLSFKNDLDAVYTAMKAQDTTVGSSISGDASSINGTVANENN